MIYTNDAINSKVKNKKFIKSIISFVIYLILIPLLVYNFVIILESMKNPDQTAYFLDYRSYVIISGSMKPEINIGDIIIIKRVTEKELKVDDIISFKEDDLIVTHRVTNIKINEDGSRIFYTKGDNNNVGDLSEKTYDMIDGKVIKIIPKIGVILIKLQSKVLVAILLVLIYLNILILRAISKKKQKRRIKRIEYEKGLRNN